jgi:hypothetical protein
MLIILLFSYSAFLWDNDGGLEIQDYVFQIGTETYICSSLVHNGIETTVETILPFIGELMAYDMLWINCAWRDGEIIDSMDRMKISAFIDSGKSVYLEGNRVASNLENIDSAFIRKFGVKSAGTATSIYPPVEGFPETFLQGEIFDYNPFVDLNSGVDILDTVMGSNAEYIYGTQEGKAILSMGIGASGLERKNSDSTYSTLLGSLSMCGLRNDTTFSSFTDEERRMEFVQKVLGYFGYGSILVVDDNESPDDELEDDLDSLGVEYNSINYDTIPDYQILRDYNVILWTTGFESKYTIPDMSQTAISDYLDWGGRVFLTGEGIGSNIGNPTQGEETSFLELFGTDYISDSIYVDSVFGINEYNGFNSGLYSPGADSIDTLSGGEVILKYFPSKTPAGINKEEANRKTTFFSFAYEGLTDINGRLNLLRKIMCGFNFSLARASGIAEEREEISKEIFSYPNPFTHYTTITTRSNSFEIYSITGRFVNKVEGERWYGNDKDGSLLPSGIYLFKSKSGEKGKVIFLR